MKVSLLHSFYRSRQPSGENVVVVQQAELLRSAGVEVGLVARYSDGLGGRPLEPVRSAVTVASGWGPDPSDALRAQRPDVVHIHNLFPNFGTRWLSRWRGPVVVTLHNYRPMCANALLLRDGLFCRCCVDMNSVQAVRHGCYRDSRLASIPLALSTRGGVAANPVLRRADAIVMLSPVQREIYVGAGLDPSKVLVVPHGLPDHETRDRPRDGWVFVGRLTPEKGLSELLAVWPDHVPLLVIGEGPLAGPLQTRSGPHVKWRTGGPQDVAEALAAAEGLVFPSLAVECLPIVAIEALRAGTPVVAREGTAAAEIVLRLKVGITYDGSEQSLLAALQACRAGGGPFHRMARGAFEEHFTQQRWLKQMLGLYASLT